jgi:hypothetical protein
MQLSLTDLRSFFLSASGSIGSTCSGIKKFGNPMQLKRTDRRSFLTEGCFGLEDATGTSSLAGSALLTSRPRSIRMPTAGDVLQLRVVVSTLCMLVFGVDDPLAPLKSKKHKI